MNRQPASEGIRINRSEDLLEALESGFWDERDLHRGPVRHALDAADPDADLEEGGEHQARAHSSGTGQNRASAAADHGCCR